MHKEMPIARALRLVFGTGVAVGIAASMSVAHAQQDVQRGERVEITGSNIKRVDAEGANPVQVITRKEIERNPATNVNELLQQITGAGIGLDDRFTNGFAPGGGGVNLRNLGFNSTLVLLNGRRLPTFPFAQQLGTSQGFNDIQSIPLAAVDRIEILKDGASAIYGADAVAGVINIILRQDYQGLEASADYGQSSRRDGQGTGVNITAGFGDLAKDRFNVLGGLFFRNSAQVYSRDRPWAGTEDLRKFGGTDQRSGTGFPGTFFDLDNDNPNILGPGCGPTTQIGGNSNRGGVCRYDRAQFGSLLPKTSRDGVYLRGQFAVTPDITAFAEGMLSQARERATSWPAGTTDDVGIGENIIPGNNPNNPFPGDTTQVAYRFADVGNRNTVTTDVTKRLVVGLKGTTAGFDWELGAMTNRVNAESLATNNALNSHAFCLTNPQAAAIYAAGGDPLGNGTLDQIFAGNPATAAYFRNQLAGCAAAFAKFGYYNYLNPAANNPAIAGYLRNDAGRLGRSVLNSVDAKVSRDLFQLPGGPLAIAIGAEFRKEKVSDVPDIELQTGDTLSISAAQAFGQRHVASAYAELVAPILKSLEVDMAIRGDRFSTDGGGTFGSGSPKIGIRWQPIKELLLRGTASEAFRAPSLFETSPAQQTSFTFGIQDPVKCPTAAFSDTNPACVLDVRRVQAGNPNLGPERSKAMTVGMVFQPVDNISFSIDEWRVNRKNEIGSFLDQTLVNLFPTDPNIVVRNGAGDIVQLNVVPVQLTKTTTYGTDYEFNMRNNLGWLGRLSTKLTATYVQRFQATSINANNQLVPVELNDTEGQPRFRAGYDFVLTHGSSEFNIGGYTIGSYTGLGISGTPGHRVGAQEIWNIGYAFTGIKNLTVRFQVNNIFDRAPPFDDETNGSNAGYNPTLSDPFGRSYRLTASYKFF